ncbi:MAG: 16S rRNA (guanine(966)-N(2))-methyltransferase RsmD [candidate division Zixibacteria bacterium RBG_16_40_9]|nr:MAG: 16S rRNA (guanine(966)-N(2))-methyltransferase RsmD [candidate division Zixibacteria bacterium RBG_16_40_9]
MRIISGDFKGRKLKSVGKLRIRPPLDKVKQAIFDILKNDVVDREVLDLFAGSGSLGIEAVSRGAKKVIFVESSFKNQKILKENIKMLNLEDKVEMILANVSKFLDILSEKKQKFDLIFIDPPFLKNWAQKVLDKIEQFQILKSEGIVILHHHKKEIPRTSRFLLVKQRKFGDNLVSFYILKQEGR